MHWRGHSEDMQSKASYADVVTEVITELAHSARCGHSTWGSARQVDHRSGLGFAKTGEHNW